MIVSRVLVVLALGFGSACTLTSADARNPKDAAPRSDSAAASDAATSASASGTPSATPAADCREEVDGQRFIDGWPVVDIVEVAGTSLTLVEQVGNTLSTVAFLLGDDCPFTNVTHDEDADGLFGWYAAGIGCVPDCGVGLACTTNGVAAMEWKAVVPGPDGEDLPLAEILRDPDITVDDVVVRTARRGWRLDAQEWTPLTDPVLAVVPVGDGSLDTFNEGLLCGGKEFGSYGQPASRQDIIDFLDLRTFDE